MNNKKGINFYY